MEKDFEISQYSSNDPLADTNEIALVTAKTRGHRINIPAPTQVEVAPGSKGSINEAEEPDPYTQSVFTDNDNATATQMNLFT